MGPLAHPNTRARTRIRKSSWKDLEVLKSITNRLHFHFHFSIFGKCSGPQAIFYYCFWNKQHEYMNERSLDANGARGTVCVRAWMYRSSTYMCIGKCTENWEWDKQGREWGRESEWSDSMEQSTLKSKSYAYTEWATVNNSRNFPDRYRWYGEGCRRRRRRRWRRYPFRCLIPVTCLHFLSILYLYLAQMLLKATVVFPTLLLLAGSKKMQKNINKFQFLFSTVVKSTTLIITAMLGIQYLLLVCLLCALE